MEPDDADPNGSEPASKMAAKDSVVLMRQALHHECYIVLKVTDEA